MGYTTFKGVIHKRCTIRVIGGKTSYRTIVSNVPTRIGRLGICIAGAGSYVGRATIGIRGKLMQMRLPTVDFVALLSSGWF